MIKNAFAVFGFGLLISSCATVQDYSPPQQSNISKITVKRDLEDPLLGTGTFLFKLSSARGCRDGLNVNEDKRVMVIDKTNPLIKQLNENGVAIESDTPFIFRLQSVAGPLYSCTIQAGFTPASDRDYEIRLLGRIDVIPHECAAELWRKLSGLDDFEKVQFETYDVCR